MSEIKFRGWNDLNKKFVYWTLNDLLCRFGDPHYQFGVEDRPSPFFDWMPYIGIKDKKDKDIYTGDIGKIRYKNIYYLIVKHGANYVGKIFHKDGFDLINLYFDKDHNIVGNIKENPELISNATN